MSDSRVDTHHVTWKVLTHHTLPRSFYFPLTMVLYTRNLKYRTLQVHNLGIIFLYLLCHSIIKLYFCKSFLTTFFIFSLSNIYIYIYVCVCVCVCVWCLQNFRITISTAYIIISKKAPFFGHVSSENSVTKTS